ncbi:Ger(x)C family spore germination protein [Paenibacillus daejeonensis]|uniref:Ger(x)C family spore germination protein n=1 Tax=Paenibacillus daejeonensis TaxID=135193 RepID=UPI0003663638|nr:Ger(x)C family spore germination protein [Paenibacillus daejeonensis]
MRLRVLHIVIAGLILLSATGCWDRKELNELGIVLAMAVDKDGDKGYKVSCQVVVPSEVASNSGKSTTTTVTLVQATATTIHEALYKMTLSSPRLSYMSHVRLLVFSEEVAREGIADTLEALIRDPNFRPDYYITIARGSPAEDILTILTPLESIPANSLFYSLKNSSDSWAPTIAAYADDTVEKMVSSGVEPVLTGVRILGDRVAGGSKDNLTHIKPEARLMFTGMAVLIRDRLIGWMDEDESKGYNYIAGNVKETTGHMNCPEGEGVVSLVLLRSTSKIIPRLVNGKPAFDVKLQVVQTIYGDSCETSLSSDYAIRQLQKISERKLIKIMEDSVNAAQHRLRSDIFGFGREFYRKYPLHWKTLAMNWNETFPSVKVNIEVEAQIRRIGTLDDSIIKQMKEEMPE